LEPQYIKTAVFSPAPKVRWQKTAKAGYKITNFGTGLPHLLSKCRETIKKQKNFLPLSRNKEEKNEALHQNLFDCEPLVRLDFAVNFFQGMLPLRKLWC
jgi:hypothetical protein